MIFCALASLPQYQGLDCRLDEAIRFVLRSDIAALPKGRHEVSGDDVYANRLSFETVPEDQTLFETHVHFTDIHIICAGGERIWCAQAAELKQVEADPDNDYYALEGEADAVFDLAPGCVLIVFPGEAHKVKGMVGQPAWVEKLVVKIRQAGR